jgi:hypothetical protein
MRRENSGARRQRHGHSGLVRMLTFRKQRLGPRSGQTHRGQRLPHARHSTLYDSAQPWLGASCQVSQHAFFGCWEILQPTRHLGGPTKSTAQHLVRSRMYPTQSLPSLWSPKWLSINSHSRISSRSNKLNGPATSLKRPEPNAQRTSPSVRKRTIVARRQTRLRAHCGWPKVSRCLTAQPFDLRHSSLAGPLLDEPMG